MLTRLSALLHPLATVGQVNAALQGADARISFMRSGSLVVTLKVPRLANLAAAQTLSDALGRTGAFLSVSPAISPILDPPEEIEAEVITLLMPGGGADAHIAHLQAIAAPSAWNLRQLAFDVGAMVPVLVPDAYVRAITSTQIGNLAFVTERETTTESNPNRWYWVGNHGWHVAGTIGADFDDERSTGFHPGALPGGASPIFRIDALSVLGVGLTNDEFNAEIIDRFPPTGPFVINASFGYRYIRELDRQRRLLLAQQSLALRAATSGQEERFVIAAAAGNDYGHDARFASDFIANASFDDVREMVTDPDDRAVIDELLAWYQSTYPDVDFLRRSRNVLAVGSSRHDGSPSAFTNSIALLPPGVGVRAVGSDVFGPCARRDRGAGTDDSPYYCPTDDGDVLMSGTSMAAPQVAGLAAYMWNLNPTLRAAEIVETIARTYRNGLIDAYEAALAAGGLPARRALLDVDDDGRFDQVDLQEILSQWSTGLAPRSFARYDLNGSGRAGGVTRARFDLDGDGLYGAVSATIGTLDVTFDETAVTDAEVLCYYAHHPDVYDGDPIQRAALLADACEGGVPGGTLTLQIRDAVLGEAFDHVDLDVCASGACVVVTPRFLAPGSLAIDLPADTSYDVHVIAPGYVGGLLTGVRLGSGELLERAVELTVDTSRTIDFFNVRVLVFDADTGSEIAAGITSKLRAGVGVTEGEYVLARIEQRSPISIGAFDFPAGYYTVEVDREGYEPVWWSVALPAGQNLHPFERRLVPSPTDDLLSVSVHGAPQTITIGDPLPFDVTIVNHWTRPIDDVTLRIEVNGDVDVLSTPAGCRYLQGASAGVFTCTLSSLAAGASRTWTPVVSPVSIGFGSSVVVVAEITGWDGPADPDPSNNAASTFVLIDLDDPPVLTTIEVTPASAQADPGGFVDFGATAFDQDGQAVPGMLFTWASDHPCVATVSASGRATALGAPGTAGIRASAGAVEGAAALVVTPTAGSTPASVAGRWLVCETSSGEHLLTLDLVHASGQTSVTGDVTMANGARSSASGSWLNDALGVNWSLLVQGSERPFSIVGATPTDEHALRGSYNDRYSLTTYDVDLVRVPIP